MKEPEPKSAVAGPTVPIQLSNDMTSHQQKPMALPKIRRLSRQYSTEFTNGRITFTGRQGSDKHRITLTMAWHTSVSWFSRTAIFLSLISLILNIISFVSPYWMFVEDALGTSYSGLWTVCIFEVCGDFLHHSMFVWFHIVQAMMCLSLLSQLISLVSSLVYVMAPVRAKRKKTVVGTALISTLLAIVFSFTGFTLYGIQQGKRGVDTLSWGFAFAIVACFFMILSSIPLGFELRRILKVQSDQVPILPTIKGIKTTSRPALHHSASVDSCVALRTDENSNEKKVTAMRPRSASQVRMRVNSVSQDCPPTPMPGDIEEESGAVFDFDNDCFVP